MPPAAAAATARAIRRQSPPQRAPPRPLPAGPGEAFTRQPALASSTLPTLFLVVHPAGCISWGKTRHLGRRTRDTPWGRRPQPTAIVDSLGIALYSIASSQLDPYPWRWQPIDPAQPLRQVCSFSCCCSHASLPIRPTGVVSSIGDASCILYVIMYLKNLDCWVLCHLMP